MAQVMQDGSRSQLRSGMAFQIQDDILDVTSTTRDCLENRFTVMKKNEKTTYVTMDRD